MCRDSYLYLPLFKCKGDCFLPLTSNNMPVPYVKYEAHHQIIYPNSYGYLELKAGTLFHLTCSNYNQFVIDECTYEISEIQVMCYQYDVVLFNGGYFKFDKFLCTDTPISDITVTSESCKDQKDIVAYVGFNTSEGFLTQYGICFDTIEMNSLYTWYEARMPYTNDRVEYSPIPVIAKPSILYNGLDVKSRYEPKSQVSIIGINM